MAVITRSKGGNAERQVDIHAYDVPDLYQIAEYMREHEPSLMFGTGVKAHEAILECWHLCHDLIKHIEEMEVHEACVTHENRIQEQVTA